MNVCTSHLPDPDTLPVAVSFPVLVWKRLFRFLGENDRKSIRLVCTHLNFMVRTLCLYPSNIYMGISGDSERGDFEYNEEEEHSKTFLQCMDMNLDEGMYYFYAPASKMKMEKIWIKYFQSLLLKNMTEFKELVHQVRHLEIKEISFEDRQSVIDFLNLFVNLAKLNVKYCRLTKESLTKSSQIFLPSQIKGLAIEHRHNDVNLPGIFTSLGEGNLVQFSLHIVNCENVLRKDCYGTKEFSDLIISKVRTIIITQQVSLRKLRIKWDTKELCSEDKSKKISFHSVAAIILPIITLYRRNFLYLTELSIELSEINTSHTDFTATIVPFIKKQVNGILRKITLSELTGIFAPDTLFLALCPSNKDYNMKKQDINLSVTITNVGHPEYADLNRQYLSWKIPKTCMTSLTVEIMEENKIQKIPRLFIREYSFLMSHESRYSKLEKFHLICSSKLFESFSIPKICNQYFNLTTLSIIDGPEFAYNERENINSQYDFMSCATVTDFDMRFIIEKLNKLQSLKIWANMKSLTDFGIVGGRPELIRKTCREDAEKFLRMILANKLNYADMSISSGLKDLEYLSLRGVGNRITNLSVSLGFHDMKNLKQLEILGDHQVTEELQDVLRKSVGCHININ